MAERKQFNTNLTVNTELAELLKAAHGTPATEEELREQRVSFAFGNALKSERITKDSVRKASQNIRLK